MINSFGTGKPTEADGSGRKRTEADGGRGSGRKRRQLVGLVGCSGGSAVRLFGLFGCSGGGGSPPPHGQRRAVAKPPTAEGDSSSNSRFQQLIFLRLSPNGGSGWKPSPDDGKIHRCAGGCAVGGSPPPHGQRRAQRSPTPKKQLFSLFVFVLCAIYY